MISTIITNDRAQFDSNDVLSCNDLEQVERYRHHQTITVASIDAKLIDDDIDPDLRRRTQAAYLLNVALLEVIEQRRDTLLRKLPR